jgi:LPS export ABC transporter protein LptC
MNRNFHIFNHNIFTAALLMGCFFLAACENDPKEIEALTGKRVEIEEGYNIESYLSQSGVMKARLKAPKMLRVLSDTIYVEFPNNLHVDFYNDSLEIETYLDSRYGKYFEKEDKVYLRDSVVVITVSGDTLKAPDLWWDQRSKMFYTDKYARYHTRERIIHGGTGMEATQDLSTVTFRDPTGRVKVGESLE